MKLLILAHKFPYASSEVFLEREIRVLAQHFEEILVVPTSPLTTSQKPLYEIPDNARVELGVSQFIHERVTQGGILRKNLDTFTAQALLLNVFRLGVQNTRLILGVLGDGLLIREALLKCVDLESFKTGYAFWSDSLALGLGLLKRTHSQLHVVARSHRFDLYSEGKNVPSLPFQKECMNLLDRIHPCSKEGEQYLHKKFPEVARKISVRYLGTLSSSRLSPHSPDGILRLVSCSHLIPRKRTHLILEALKSVTRKVEWTHFGDGPEMQTLQVSCKQLPPQIRAHFFGNIQNEDLLKYYETHPVDLFVNASESEGVPVSIMEAMSKGIPCIGTDVGGMREIVNSENGYLMPAEFSAQELAEIVQNHPLGSNEYQEAALRTQRTYFDAEKNYANFARELKSLEI